MVIFIFSPTEPQGYVVSTSDRIAWLHCPHDLVDRLKDIRACRQEVQAASISLHGDWFLKTNRETYYKLFDDKRSVISSSSLGVFFRTASTHFNTHSLNSIQSFTFMPNPAGYFCVFQDASGLNRYVWSKVPYTLDKHLDKAVSKGIQCVSVGHGGSWVVVDLDGHTTFSGISEDLARKLKSKPKRLIKQIILAPNVTGRFFIEYDDGTIDFELPDAWCSVMNTYQVTAAPRVSISAPPPILKASNIPLPDEDVPVRFEDMANQSTQNLSDISAGHSREAGTDLHVHIEPPRQGTFYMPGMEINGSVRCNSGYFNHGSISSLKSIRVSLVGEFCAFVNDDGGTTRFDSDEIMNHAVVIYSADDPSHQELVATPRQFIKLPFKLIVAEDTSARIGATPSENGRISLPPSFSDEHIMKYRYIKYWVSASGTRFSGEPPCINSKEIKVMPWDPEPMRPKFKFPQLKARDPITLQDPTSKWKIVTHWTPLMITTHKRSEFFDRAMPNEAFVDQSVALCNDCYETIYGPRFFCCQCEGEDFNWCWSCMSEYNRTHDTTHVFVRIESSDNTDDYNQRNRAARSAAAAAAQEASPIILDIGAETPSLELNGETNTIIHVTTEATHEIWIPNSMTFAFDTDIPLLMVIKIGSAAKDTIQDFLPTLPWDSNFITTKGPTTSLNVYLDSHMERLKDSVPFGSFEWGFPPSEPSGTNLNQNWTTPTCNEAGKWVQSAIVCQVIGECSDSGTQRNQLQRQPHINLSLLRTRFQLHVKHQVGMQPIDITISDAPWTSGIYREIAQSSKADTVKVVVAPQPRTAERESGPSMVDYKQDPPPPYNKVGIDS